MTQAIHPCPACAHYPHTSGPCVSCGEDCGYPRTMLAAVERLHEAVGEVGREFAKTPPRRFILWLDRKTWRRP